MRITHPLQTRVSQLDWRPLYEDLKKRDLLKDPQTIKELFYIRGYRDFRFFVETFFAHHLKFPFSRMHLDFFKDELEPARRGRREAYAAPRSHAKSTFKVMFKVIHAIVYGYEPYIVIFGHAAEESEKRVEDILGELENNELLIEVYGALAPVRGQFGGVARWGNKRFTAQNGCRVEAKSRNKQVRGMKHGHERPSLIICDDVEAPEKVLTETQRLKTRYWFQKDVLKLGLVDGSSNIIVIGTLLHSESLLSELLVTPGWTSRKYQAVESFAENQALWRDWERLYNDLSDPSHEMKAEVFFAKHRKEMLKGTKVLWPEGDPYKKLMKMVQSEGLASFHSEKQNDPYDPERQIFNMAQAKQVYLKFTEAGALHEIQWLDGSGKVVPVSNLERIIAFHDPALANTQQSDFAAIVVAAKDFDGFIYCLDAYIEKVIPSLQLEHAYQLQKKWGFETLYLETNNFQEVLREDYQEMQERHPDQLLWVVGIKQHHNKLKRISSLEPLVTYGRLLFADSLPQRLITQLSLFPTTNDDGPDALQGAVTQLQYTLGEITQLVHGSILT